MIKGNQINYNPLQLEMNDIIGSVYDQSGLTFYFHNLFITFSKAELALWENAKKYSEGFNNETQEIRQSIFSDPSHQVQSLPLLEPLRKSYFVIIHSEIGKVWEKIQGIYNKKFSQKKIQSLNYEYKYDTNNVLDEIVSKYSILFAYNSIRNKNIHLNTDDSKYKFSKEFMENYAKRNIEYFKIINDDATKMDLIITDMKFGKKYSEIFIQLLN